jgi:P27 family predicted phage terminase small subunit
VGSRGPKPNPDSARQKALARKREQAQRLDGRRRRWPEAPKPSEKPSETIAGNPPELSEGVEFPEGLGVWGRAAWAQLVGLPQIRPGDRIALLRLCELEDDVVHWRGLIGEQGTVVKRPVQSSRGELLGWDFVEHPLIRQLRKAEAVALGLLVELGLTPRARERLGLAVVNPPEAKPDKLDELQARRRQRLAALGRA